MADPGGDPRVPRTFQSIALVQLASYLSVFVAIAV